MYIKSSNPENRVRINLNHGTDYAPGIDRWDINEFCIIFKRNGNPIERWVYSNREQRDRDIDRIDTLLKTNFLIDF